MWKLKRILSPEGLNIEFQPNEKGYCYNVMVEWGTGETIIEYITIIIGGETVAFALYADYGQVKVE